MNKNKNLALRIVAGVVAVALIVIIVSFTNAFVGNPISAHFAKKDIVYYVEEKYENLDLELGKVGYNFKDGKYFSVAKSKTNEDIHFAIYWTKGKVLRDNYESYVLSGFNTLDRLSDEYSTYTTNLLNSKLDYEITKASVNYDYKGSHLGDYDGIIELGMKFDKTLKVDSALTIFTNLQDSSIGNIANKLSEIHKALKDDGCDFEEYGLSFEDDGLLVMVYEVTPQDIEGDNFLEKLQYAKDNPESSDIRIFIKGEKVK